MTKGNEKDLIIFAGMIKNATAMNANVLTFISELNCEYGIQLYILVKYDQLPVSQIQKSKKNCAQVVVEYENQIIILREVSNDKNMNRIDKLSKLRDYQRSRLKQMFEGRSTSSSHTNEDGIIILADLDIQGFPDSAHVIDQIHKIQQPNYKHSIVCTNGIIKHWSTESQENYEWYYDTFATVFLPNFSLLKKKNRLIQSKSNNEGGRNRPNQFSQYLIYKYILSRGEESPTGNFSVKSCFGGMSLYKTKAFFTPQCQYELDRDVLSSQANDISSIMRYASKHEKRPCEHVVFHDCLKQNVPEIDIAINPKLLTYWK